MALNLADRLAVREVIIPRCVAAVNNYANYLLGGGDPQDPPTTPQIAWAREAMRNPTSYGEQVSYYVLYQTAFINNGSSIDDPTLTGIVETAIRDNFVADA